jgi:hypothetical protein
VRSKIPSTGNHPKTLRSVITSRSMHGYSAKKHDASTVKSPKTLRRQFGRSYYQKKVRNNSAHRKRTSSDGSPGPCRSSDSRWHRKRMSSSSNRDMLSGGAVPWHHNYWWCHSARVRRDRLTTGGIIHHGIRAAVGIDGLNHPVKTVINIITPHFRKIYFEPVAGLLVAA